VEKREGRKDWESWIDQQIREAQDRGQFDNLPGKGKPLDLTPNPYAQDRELAFKVLKDAGYAPDWIELDKAIRGKLEQVQATLTRQWQWRETRLGELANRSDSWSMAEQERVRHSWRKAIVAFEQEIAAINAEITELNLKVPAPRFQRPKIDAARELERLTGKAT
jgi:DnaJ family protein C protein 28